MQNLSFGNRLFTLSLSRNIEHFKMGLRTALVSICEKCLRDCSRKITHRSRNYAPWNLVQSRVYTTLTLVDYSPFGYRSGAYMLRARYFVLFHCRYSSYCHFLVHVESDGYPAGRDNGDGWKDYDDEGSQGLSSNKKFVVCALFDWAAMSPCWSQD